MNRSSCLVWSQEALLQLTGPPCCRSWQSPWSALCSPESRYKQKYIASQTRVFKRKRTYAGVLDVRLQAFEISTSVRMYLLYCVFPELISSRYGSLSGSLWASDHPCLGLTDSYNFWESPLSLTETFPSAPKEDSDLTSHLKAFLAPPSLSIKSD